MANKFAPETVKRVQAFRLDPSTARMQAKEIAEKLSLHPCTVSSIENSEGYWDEVFSEVRKVNRKREAVIWDALIKQCERGSLEHIKLYLEMTGLYDESAGKSNPPQIVVIREPRPD